MAAGGFKDFEPNEILDEDDINDFLMQGVLVFDDSSARTSAITSPVEGQFSFLKSTNTMEFYDGSAWKKYTRSIKPAVVSSTTGDVTTTTVGSDTVYTFDFVPPGLGTGSMVFSSGGAVDVLVVGGGGYSRGSNSNEAGGGGGGGGVLEVNNFYVPAGTVTLRVGVGQIQISSPELATSFFGPLSAGGGGAGGGPEPKPQGGLVGSNGPSSGGGYASATGFAPGATLVGPQGNSGGAGFGSATTTVRAGGGGGGAGGPGTAGSNNVGGNGGPGIASSITGTSLFYGAGGGGGTSSTGGTGGLGGSGIGGNGGAGVAGASASPAGRGSGGGGAGNNNNGGAGSPGVVIVRVRAA
jgi:hypothetical protein